MTDRNPLKALTQGISESALRLKPLPETLNSGGDISASTSGYFDQAKLLTLPMPITIPNQTGEYSLYSSSVFATEWNIRCELVRYRASLSPEKQATFDEKLLEFPPTRNILLKVLAAQETNQYLGAGICLGSDRSDDTLGRELLNLIRRPFTATGGTPSEDMTTHCLAWGSYHAKARTMILNATWRNLVGRDDWPMPPGFAKNISRLLEQEFPEALRSERSYYSLTEEHRDRYHVWFSHVELLNERRATGDSAGRMNDKTLPEVPKKVYRQDDRITGILISDQQALNYWSRYLAIPSLKRVDLVVSLTKGVRSSTSKSNLYKDYFHGEMLSLAHNPLAPLISSLRVNASGLTVNHAKTVLKGWLGFLTALATTSTWRSASQTQKIDLVFANTNYELSEFLYGLAPKPLAFDKLSVGAAREQTTKTGTPSVIISASVGSR
jgi:hypothetical protein